MVGTLSSYRVGLRASSWLRVGQGEGLPRHSRHSSPSSQLAQALALARVVVLVLLIFSGVRCRRGRDE